MVPPMEEAAPNAKWQGTAKDLVAVSHWIQENWLLAFSFFPAVFLTIYATIVLYAVALLISLVMVKPTKKEA
jgi:hypothetical protein